MKSVRFLIVSLALLALSGCAPAATPRQPGQLLVVSTIFPGYDFARHAAADRAQVQLLLPPGAESHSYEPTPADILAVQQCDLFVYLGGESDAWVETLLDAARPAGTVLAMVECVETVPEVYVEGMEAPADHDHDDHDDHDHDDHDHDDGLGTVTQIDEHVWTDPDNAAAITRRIGEALAAIDADRAAAYRTDAETYAQEIESLGADFAAFFDTVPDKTMVFGDRFPLRYFAQRYDLRYFAAFPGCSTQTEPSAATVAFLTDKVRQEGIATVWYIEFSNHLVADAVAEAAGAQTALFHSCHNVSSQEIRDGATYVTLMQGNLERLRQHMDHKAPKAAPPR